MTMFSTFGSRAWFAMSKFTAWLGETTLMDTTVTDVSGFSDVGGSGDEWTDYGPTLPEGWKQGTPWGGGWKLPEGGWSRYVTGDQGQIAALNLSSTDAVLTVYETGRGSDSFVSLGFTLCGAGTTLSVSIEGGTSPLGGDPYLEYRYFLPDGTEIFPDALTGAGSWSVDIPEGVCFVELHMHAASDGYSDGEGHFVAYGGAVSASFI